MPTWTPEQQQAIDQEGTNIIVSAGAGSGKTAVLTARVLRKLKDGVDIDRLLILTFTKAAAKEMKERIRRAIKKEPSLSAQLSKLDQAYITTFDSYAYSFVKKYHYLINVSASFEIGEASIFHQEEVAILDRLFMEEYTKKKKDFQHLMYTFFTKEDQELKTALLDMYHKIDLRYDKEEYLKHYFELFYTDNVLKDRITEYFKLIQKKLEMLSSMGNELEQLTEGYGDKLAEVLIPLQEATDYDSIRSHLDFRFPNLPKGSSEEAKAKKKEMSDLVKEIKQLCRFTSLEEIRELLENSKEDVGCLLRILQKLDKEISQFKEFHDRYEFIDISKMAIRILETSESVRLETRDFFHEIMVDEYQDTNDLQELFLSKISHSNIYMVGDIKQSIYRFRNANPYLFQWKYDHYSRLEDGIKIDLNKNFRSRKEVLDPINAMFNRIMDQTLGGADYADTHQMVFGNQLYETVGANSDNDQVEFYEYCQAENTEYSKEEIEAFIIANDIQKKVAHKFQVFDKEENVLRPIRYADFAILLDRSTQFPLYKKIFEYLQIPLTIEKDESITNEVDLLLLKNIFGLLQQEYKKQYDNLYRYTFVSLARSYLYRLSDEEIFLYLKNESYQKAPFYEIVRTLAEEMDYFTPHQLWTKVLELFPFYEKIVTVGEIEDHLNRFDYLGKLIFNLQDLGYTCHDLYSFFDELIAQDLSLTYAATKESSDSCKIMTIHKSKGLEYPICYFAGLTAKFNFGDIKNRFFYDNTYGILVPYFKEGVGDSVLKELVKEKYQEEEISEKIRLFYVALTRAREKMIFVLPQTEYYDYGSTLLSLSVRRRYRSFLDILKSILIQFENQIVLIDLKELSLSKDYNISKRVDLRKTIPACQEQVEIREIPVSSEEMQSSSYSKKVRQLLSMEDHNKIEFGKRMHRILETIDLQNPKLDELTISDFERKKVEAFLNQPLLANRNQATIYQEQSFTTMIDKVEYHGVIDLLLVLEDRCIVVDYKLKYTADEAYQRQLQGYAQFVESKFHRPVEVYLYSILDEVMEKEELCIKI